MVHRELLFICTKLLSTSMKHCAVLVFSFLLSSALVAQNFNDTIDYPGDIAFIGFSAGPGGASDEDGFSFVLLDSCPPNTLIRFTDEEWLGTAFASLGAAADVTWENTTGSGISAGTVIDMTDTDNNNSGISASSGTAVVDFGVFSVASGDQIYAFLGTRASPFPFLAFIGQDSSLNSSQTAVLDGTGLVAGKTAILTNTEGYFSGSTTCGTDIAACIATINDSANWTLGPYTHPTPVASGFSGAAFAPPAVSISITTQIDNVCVGGSDGQLIATAVPGMGNYTYDWSNSASTINTISTKDTISGLVAGTYTVTVTDANLNTATATATITSPGGPAFSATLFISPVLCHGDSNGQAIAVPNQFPSTYIWSNSETTQTIDSLPAGPYSVTITNNSGCSIVRSISLSEPDSLEITTTVSNNATCNGFTDGSISSTRMGGSGPFTYNWSNGATSANLNSLGAGTYTVTITDNNGCTDTSSSVITQPTPLVVSTVIDSSASCSGGSNGGITASASGSVPTYNYLWSNGATTPSVTGIATGTYTVTVTDMAGCTGTSSETVTQPPPLVPSTTVDNNVSCNGGSDGQGTVSAVGGTAPYTYNWSNLVTTASNSGLSVGTYTVTVTDNNGCFELDSVVITEPAAIVASISSSTNLTCNGVPTGAATASATGGTGAYTYTWSNAATTANISGVAAGTYTVSITDANSCGPSTASVTITEPAAIVANTALDSNVSCNGLSDGGATASAIGGTPPYTYSWSSLETTASITGKAAGTYTVSITDANSCGPSTASITITEPTVLGGSITSSTNLACNGVSTGAATAAGSGGTAPYTYLWSTTATTANISGLAAGTYTVSITDANSCPTVTASTTLTEPAAIVASISSSTNLTCNGVPTGAATASATGGTGAYTYTWSNAATTANISGVAAGTYTVSITDANSCGPSTASVTITEPAAIVANTALDSNVSCNGLSDGGATASAIGGTPPYTYNWSSLETTASITGKAAGTYTVSITDANSCGPSTATITFTEPTVLGGSITSSTNLACNGVSTGTATAAGSGGTAPYTYLWTDSETTASITGKAAGTYTVTISDANNCPTVTASTTLTEPAAIIASITLDSNASCNGLSDGGATASATGGTGAYTYNWSNAPTTASNQGIGAGTYTVSITDANGCGPSSASITITEPTAIVASITLDSNVSCNGLSDGGATASATGGTGTYTYNWSNGPTTASNQGVAAGTYTVSITDANGCGPSTTSITITEPAVIVASITLDSNVSCNGQSDGGATASAIGGTPPYTYNWSSLETAASITGKAAGTYTVSITDANNCGPSTATITFTEPTILGGSITSSTNLVCNGVSTGTATAAGSGGTAPYAYLWSNSGNTPTISGLPAGTYTVTISDANNCPTVTASTTLTEPAAIVASITLDSNASCNGLSDGGATASATGGTGAYTYNWSNAPTTASNQGIAAGTYTVSITDANGCGPSTASITITEPTAIVASITLDSNVSCNGLSDGGATASAIGGTPPYTYNWSSLETTASITGKAAGTYTVSIADANSCGPSTATITFTEPTVLGGSITSSTNLACNGVSTGTATAAGSGGTAPYTYLWTDSETTASITGKAAGTYTVTISDANNCPTVTASTTLTEPAAIIASITLDSNASCNGLSDGGATASATGGTGAYTYNWSNAPTTASNQGIGAGTYTVSITDANGCGPSSASITITEPTAIVASITLDSNVSCNGLSDGGATASATGGTGTYTYNWSNGPTTASNQGVAAGTYTVSITDANGCGPSTASITITEPAAIVASITLDSNVSCNGQSDGGVTASATGGTGAYTYNWSNSPTTASNQGIAAGTYTVSITDANGCGPSTASITITEPTTIVASITLDSNVSCNGLSDGGATASATGGTGAYTYNWSNSPTTASNQGIAAGTYTVSVYDANGCGPSTASITITEPTTIVASITLDSNVSCNGLSDGGATASATGGTGAYTYNWSNSPTTASNQGIAAGTYTVSVYDANGCGPSTASITITEPTTIVASITLDSNVSCNGLSDGGATASATGGTGAYTYNWSNSPTTASNQGIAAGTYTVSVYDANGCGPSTASITITEPTAIVASITLDSNVSCNGLSDGGATASATGGTGTYTYNWSNGPTTASNQGIAAGTYTVSITDANGCGPSTASITITEPAPIIVNIVVDSNATCIGNMDGGATATASGGAIPYTYSWSNSDVTASISGVADGTYSVIVTDANGCSGVDTTDIVVVDTIKPTVVTIDTTIYLASSGLFTIDSSFVNNGSFDNCTVARIELDSTNFDCSELGSNTVQLIVTDINGNIDSAAATVTVRDTILPTINNCPADIIVSTDPSNCAAVVNWTAPTAADNCTVDSLVGNFTSGSTFPIGTTTVRYIAYDQGLLTDTCFFTITVVDNEEPVITNVPANINVNNEADSCSALATWTPPTAADNCTLDSLVSNITPGSRFPVGITSIEYIAYDNALNTDTISFTVTVNDIEPPTISCPADTTICAPIFTFSIPNGADNCAVLSVVQIEGITSGGNYPVGATANKFLITDVNGNVDSCSFIVTRIAEPTVANAGNDSTICSDSIRLSANVPVIGNGSWSSPDAAIIFDDGTDPTSQARNLSRGLNSIVWTISNGICNVSRDTVEITFENDPSPSMAGPDQLLCEQFQTNLAANTPAIGNGIWTILSGSGNLSSNTSPTASLSGLSPGSTQLSWTITNAVCQPSIDSVTVVVSNNPTADAGPDQKIFTSDGTTLTVSSDSSGSPLTRYQWQPSNLLDDPMSASTSSNDNLNSSTEFIVVVTSSIGCEGRDTVFVEVNGSFTLPTAFTPNNDGYNDTWEIKNLESDLISSHRIAVFNNSGSEIFSSTNYQPWDGRFNGEDLPVGSYYFVLELERTDGEKEVKTGVVSILK